MRCSVCGKMAGTLAEINGQRLCTDCEKIAAQFNKNSRYEIENEQLEAEILKTIDQNEKETAPTQDSPKNRVEAATPQYH